MELEAAGVSSFLGLPRALASAFASALGCGRSGEGEGELEELEKPGKIGVRKISGVPGAFGGVTELDGAGDDAPDSKNGVEVPDSKTGVEGCEGGGGRRGRTLR